MSNSSILTNLCEPVLSAQHIYGLSPIIVALLIRSAIYSECRLGHFVSVEVEFLILVI